MDIFRYKHPFSDEGFVSGEIINGIRQKTWIERYLDGNEFTFVADLSSGLRSKLPIGSFISHINTQAMMIVESHEIVDIQNKEPEIKVTGRGFETLLEQRIVGSNKDFPTTSGGADYELAASTTGTQVAEMLIEHLFAAALLHDDQEFPLVQVGTSIVNVTASPERYIKIGTVYQRALEMLAAEGLGLRSDRLNGLKGGVSLLIHDGIDRTEEVVYSQLTGDIERADYLWSVKKLKNAAYVTGRWVETFVDGPSGTEKYNRRVMHIDASDIDSYWDTEPEPGDVALIEYAMHVAARDKLAAQNDIALLRAELSKPETMPRFRSYFNVGDIATIVDRYGDSSPMRITEIVEIEDENGSSITPTFSHI